MIDQRLAFTICASNYLGKALALLRSMDTHCPEYRLRIILIDELPSHKVTAEIKERIIPLSSIAIPGIEAMRRSYDVVEFSTAVKPFCCEYLFHKMPQCSELLYLDPDIYVFNNFHSIEAELATADIVLTPHLIKPVVDGVNTAEIRIVPSGPYNLGFIGMRRSPNTMQFLRWWADKLREHCRCDHKLGLFYDQNWVTYAPVYFDNVRTIKHPGLNVAVWNLGEREIARDVAGYKVNGSEPLVFFHFSQFKMDFDHASSQLPMSAWGVERSVNEGLEKVCAEYKRALENANAGTFNVIPYHRKHANKIYYYLSVAFGRCFKWLTKQFPADFRALIRRQIQGI